MGRFSPSVLPTGGASLSAALDGGVDAFLAARNAKRQQDESLLLHGYRPQTDEEQNVPAAPPAAPVPAATPLPATGPDLAAQLDQGPLPTFKGRPAPSATQPGNPLLFARPPLGKPAGNTPGVDPSIMAEALGRHVQNQQQPVPMSAPSSGPVLASALAPRSRPVSIGGRNYVLTDEAQDAKLAEREERQLGLVERLGALGKQGYVRDSDRPAGADPSRYERPANGFSYDTQSTAARNEALAEELRRSEIVKNLRGTPTAQQHVVDPVTGKVTFFDPMKPPANLSVTPLPRGGDPAKNASDQTNKILDDYARDTKDFHHVMGGWDVLIGATKDPSLATPFAITDAYARITNPGGVVRPTTMEMIEHMGSIGQRMRKAWEKNANGALPADIVKDFQHTLYNIVAEHKAQFDKIRAQAVLRGKAAKADVEPLLQNYEVTDPSLAPVNPYRK